jgi:release factor glutamine methyltransferase
VKPDPAIVLDNHPMVYEPSDDSYLLLESVDIGKGQKVLEIGTGNGLIALHCARTADVTATDINPHAISITQRNAEQNGLKINLIRCDLFDGIRERFDVIIFNPPYLDGDEEKVKVDEWLERSWEGGRKGEEVVLEFLNNVKDFLNPRGKVYLLISLVNKGAMAYMEENFKYKRIAEKSLFFETVAVFELSQ